MGKVGLNYKPNTQDRRPPQVKYSKSQIMSRAYKIPDLKFEDQNLTSFAGLVIYQPLMLGLQIKNRLFACFRHLNLPRIFGPHVIMMLLIVHLLLGYRKLRDLDYYRDDPMVKRLLGLNQLPDVSTVSRALGSIDNLSIDRVREVCRNLVIERLTKSAIYRITLDFDGVAIFKEITADFFQFWIDDYLAIRRSGILSKVVSVVVFRFVKSFCRNNFCNNRMRINLLCV